MLNKHKHLFEIIVRAGTIVYFTPCKQQEETSSMAFQAGVSGNPNGRPKGSRNKITVVLQDKISDFLSNNIETIQQEYDQLSPNEKLKFLANILPYVMPKMKEGEEPVRLMEKGDTYNLLNSIGGIVTKRPANPLPEENKSTNSLGIPSTLSHNHV